MRAALAKTLFFDDAFITSLVRYGEASCIVRLLFRETGRRVLFFKNGLALKKGRGGSIQSPSFAKVSYLPASANKMLSLVHCDLDPLSMQFASSLKIFGFSTYLAEIIELFLPEEESATEIFDCLKQTLQAIFAVGPHAYFLRSFELKLLSFCGYLPDLADEIDKNRMVVAFDPIECVFLEAENKHSVPFSIEALKLAQSLLISPVDKIFCSDDALLKMVGRVFISRLRLLNKQHLKSVLFLKTLKNP